MTAPWIEIEALQHLDVPAGPGSSDYLWQAQFAFHVKVPPHPDWNKLKWGFNSQALYDEALERQKVFLESQFGARPETGMESPEYRTLVFRFINRPGEGLLFAVLGKIHAKTKSDAMEEAFSYYSEVKSTFPYDYTLLPAQSGPEFLQISGRDILEERNSQVDLAQIKRLEIPLFPARDAPFLQGRWQTSPRAHEQIWRSLACSPYPVLLNFSLRCTVLYEADRERLLKYADDVSKVHEPKMNKKTFAFLNQWSSMYTERRLAPWEKFFYLQIHLASPHKLNKNLFRTVGTSLALNSSSEALPGYQVIRPGLEGQVWQKRLKNLERIEPQSYLPLPRLSDIADLEEVFAVMRLPYSPPEIGFPDVNYL